MEITHLIFYNAESDSLNGRIEKVLLPNCPYGGGWVGISCVSYTCIYKYLSMCFEFFSALVTASLVKHNNEFWNNLNFKQWRSEKENSVCEKEKRQR